MLATNEIARQQMIRQQVRTWDVLDPAVLATLDQLPREVFVPQAYQGVAYADTTIPLAHGQCMLAPKLDGRILQSLALTPSDSVLEVGTGSGYLAACLAALAGEVTSLEIHADLAEGARKALAMVNASVTVQCADAMTWNTEQRFDAIAVTASLPVYDTRFEQWLKPGGRLFVVVGTGPIMQARLITRGQAGPCLSETLFETQIPALQNAKSASAFHF